MTAGAQETSTRRTSPRPRLFYLDLVRAFATVVIVLTHFNNPYLADGRYLLTNQPFGIYVGDLGVSLFLIISGAALTYTYGSREHMDLNRFYRKRFTGIYPMFWIAWIVAVLYYFVDTHGFPPISAPKQNLILTVLGMDGYLANFHVQTAYVLGEWFLGFILLFYLVFPLLLVGVKRYPVPTAAVVSVLYVASLYAQVHMPQTPWTIILTTRLPELVLGMYLMRYVRRVPAWVIVPAGIVLLLSALVEGPVPVSLRVTAVGSAFYLVLVVVARWIAIGPVRVLTAVITRYSYPIFLVHHVVIMQLYAKINTAGFHPSQFVVMFLAACAITFALAVLLERVSASVVQQFRTAFTGTWWHSVPGEAREGELTR